MNNGEKILAMLTKIQEKQEQMREEQKQMQKDIQHINGRLDLDVCKRLDALAEGQSAIEQRLDTLDEVKELAEKTSDKVDVIHAVVSQHSGAITELKKAR